jgi:hypothetical protein
MPPDSAPAPGMPTEMPAPHLSGGGDVLMVLLLVALVVAVAWFSHVVLVLPPARRPRGLARRGENPAARAEEAARLLYRFSGKASPPRAILRSEEDYHAAYRRAAARLHPDVGGDSEQFYQLQEAKVILDAHFAARVHTPAEGS